MGHELLSAKRENQILQRQLRDTEVRLGARIAELQDELEAATEEQAQFSVKNFAGFSKREKTDVLEHHPIRLAEKEKELKLAVAAIHKSQEIQNQQASEIKIQTEALLEKDAEIFVLREQLRNSRTSSAKLEDELGDLRSSMSQTFDVDFEQRGELEVELRSAKRRIRELESEVSDSDVAREKILNAHKREVARLQTDLKEALQQQQLGLEGNGVEEARRLVARLERELAEALDDAEKARAELRSVKLVVIQREGELADLRHALESQALKNDVQQRRAVVQLEAEVANVSSELERARKEASSAKAVKLNVERELTEAQIELEKLRKTQGQSRTVAHDLDDAAAERDRLRKELSSAKADISQAESELEEVAFELERLRKESAAAKVGRAEAERQSEELEAELERAKRELGSARADQQQRRAVTQLEREMEEVVGERERLRRELAAAKAGKVQAERELEDAQLELAASKSGRSQREKGLEEMKVKLETECQKLRQDLKVAEAKAKEEEHIAECELEDMRIALETDQRKILNLQRQIVEKEKEFSAELESTKRLFDESQEKIEDLERTLKRKSDALASLMEEDETNLRILQSINSNLAETANK